MVEGCLGSAGLSLDRVGTLLNTTLITFLLNDQGVVARLILTGFQKRNDRIKCMKSWKHVRLTGQ